LKSSHKVRNHCVDTLYIMARYVREWSIADFLRASDSHFHLEYIEEDDILLTLMEKLKKHNITSLPVRATATKKFTGIVDVLDLVTYAITKFSTVPRQAYESYQQMESFAKTKVKYLFDLSGRNKWITLHERRPFNELVKALSDPHTHRLGIVNERGDVVGLVSQSAVVRFFYTHRGNMDDKFRVVLSEKVEDWYHIHQQRIYTIHLNDHVYDAFRKIWELQVSGLAVVDEHGHLAANISASDIKRTRYYPIIGQMVKDLYRPIKEFLRIPEPGQNFKKKDHVPFFVHKGETMEKALEIIVENNIHRVFVVDNHRKPIAVISLCDILRKFWENGY